jgi:hypothetical protein
MTSLAVAAPPRQHPIPLPRFAISSSVERAASKALRKAESGMPAHPPKPPERGRLIVTLQAPTWLWILALALAFAANLIWWVISL